MTRLTAQLIKDQCEEIKRLDCELRGLWNAVYDCRPIGFGETMLQWHMNSVRITLDERSRKEA